MRVNYDYLKELDAKYEKHIKENGHTKKGMSLEEVNILLGF